MASDFNIKQGDTRPVLTDTLTYSDGTAANLAGATVTFVMRSQTAATPQVNATATIVTPSTGAVSYTFSATDSSVAGNFVANWLVTFADLSTMTFPTDGYLDIWVEPNLTASTAQQIVSLADAKDYLNIPGNDRSHDQKLMRFILAATPVIENITGPIVVKTFDEWYDGGNTTIGLRHRPAITLMACSIYLGPVEYALSIVATPQQGSIYSCMLDKESRITRRGPGGSLIPFPTGVDSVHAIYTAGQQAVPENVRMATLELIRANYQPTQQQGPHGVARSAEDEPSTAGPELFVTPRVREWLVPSRRHPSVA